MKKIWVLTLFLLMITANAGAFGQTTIMEEVVIKGKIQGTIPMVDGIQDLNLQKNINNLLKDNAEKIGEAAGGSTKISYEVTLNRPSMFSIILTAVGNDTLYQGVNIDMTSGKVSETKDFFYVKDDFAKIIADKSYVFGEDGLLLSAGKNAIYGEKIPYTELLQYINIASCARFIPGYKVTAATEGKRLSLKVGEVVSLYLPANPSTGYNWYLSESNKPEGFVSLGNSFFLPINKSTENAGVPGNTILFFGFTKPGNYKLIFEYKRTWTENVNQTMTYNFLVQ